MFDFMPHPANAPMTAPPVLCLSGPTGTADEWIGLEQCLGSRGACQTTDMPLVFRRKLTMAPDGAHVVAHGSAAYHALKAAIEMPLKVRSLTLIDPDIIAALPELKACPQFFGQLRMIERVTAEVAEGRTEAAATRVTNWWMGRGAWDRTSGTVQDMQVRAMPRLAAEYQGQAATPLPLLALVTLPCPVRIVAGRRAPSGIRSFARLLRVAIREVSMTLVKGARGSAHVSDPHVVAPDISNFIVSSDRGWQSQASLPVAA